MKKRDHRGGIILQVAILFFIGILTTGILTYFSEQKLSDSNVEKQVEILADEITDDVRSSLEEYPAYEWLLRYWYYNADSMDIEYDDEFRPDSATAAKCAQLASRHPELELHYVDAAQLEALPEEDQKLCAEIIYSWLITRVDQIKQAYHIDYLFCVETSEPYDSQFFLFSGADPGMVRGTNYEEVYPLGHTVSVEPSQQEAMRSALKYSSHLSDAGEYEDYYTYICSFDGHAVLIGMTYSLKSIREVVDAQTRTGTALAMLNQLGLSLLCLLLIFLFVLRPLRTVQQNIRLYKQTKDSATVANNLSRVRPQNEIGQLSEDIIELSKEIDDYLEKIENITAERERISTELSLASRIQAAMLPHIFPAFPDRREFEVYASMKPAKAVGGDFYDFFLIDDDHLCLLIADVSGKGIPGALFMMASKIILQSCAMLGKHPAEILAKTNEAICSNNQEQMFVTAWLGILEISTGRLTAANAGHEYPVVKSGDRFTMLRDKHGFVIGGMEDTCYTEYEMTLEADDKIFLYTDGVPEATDGQNVMFGTDRLLTVLNKEPAASPEKILENVQTAVERFVKEAEQFDDLTMLCIKYNGPAKSDAQNERNG